MILQKDINTIKNMAKEVLRTDNVTDIQRLGGMTNHTYKVTVNGNFFVFRIAGDGTEKVIDRKDEFKSEKLANELGINEKVLYFNQEDGSKISEYFKDAHTLSIQDMQKKEIYLAAAKVLKKLHSSNVDTGVSFEVFKMAKKYEDFILENNVKMFLDYERVKTEVLGINTHLIGFNFDHTPCHNDPLCDNWILSEGNLYLIDWEYAGMNDPFWDLADISIEACLSEEQDEDFLKAYLGKEISDIDYKRFVANKIYLDFLWSLWGKMRVPFEPSMEKYAQDRYKRTKQNLALYKKL